MPGVRRGPVEPRAAWPLVLGRLSVDLTSYTVMLDGQRLPLKASQVELVAVLIANRHRVTSREELCERIGVRNARSVDVLLSSLRRILGEGFVRTVRSRGWILESRAFEG
ncbi:MAG TPA: winged helix-turn-helix domain-containing protein [Actinomycetota bacterium]